MPGQRKTISSEPLRSLMQDRGWNNIQAAEAFSLSDTAIRKYLGQGMMPVAIGMAVDFIRLREQTQKESPDVLVLIGPAEELEKIKAVAAVMKIRTAHLTEDQ